MCFSLEMWGVKFVHSVKDIKEKVKSIYILMVCIIGGMITVSKKLLQYTFEHGYNVLRETYVNVHLSFNVHTTACADECESVL